jgi:hypothetical protein
MIIAHAQQNRSYLHSRAVVTLIKRLIVNPLLVGKEKNRALSHAVTTIWAEFGYFHNKKKMFCSAYIWDTQARDHTPTFWWHETHSLCLTAILGKLACLVLSKHLGVGTAKQNWKQVKLIKSRQRSNISSAKCQKQVTLYSQNQLLKASARAVKLSLVGKLWEDEDFKTMKMDMYCRDMWESLKVLQARGP